jgi:hypothetical protein
MNEDNNISHHDSKAEGRFFSIIPYITLFIISFIFFGFFAGYTCFFQEKTSLFVFSHDYLNDNLHQPGSLLLYLATFLTSFYYNPITGAAIISIIVVLIALMVSLILNNLTGSKSALIPVLTGIAVFYLQTRYQYLAFNNLGLLLQLCAFYLAIKYIKGWFPVIIFPLWYFANGGFAWISGLMYVLFLVLRSLRKEWIRIAALLVISFLMIYVSKEYLFFQSLRTLLLFPFSGKDTGSQLIMFLIVAGVIVLLPAIAKIRIRSSLTSRIPLKAGRVLTVFLVVLIMIPVSYFRYEEKADDYFAVEKMFYQNRFNEIGEFLKKHPASNKLTVYLGNIALCETGKLCDQLFSYRQSPDGQTLFLKWEMRAEVLRRGGYFYYTTGMINEAQRWAYENMVMDGLTPEGLKMLARTELVNGNYKVASKYIEILKHTLSYRDEANKYEKMLFNDQAVESDPELGPKRNEMVKHDFFSITGDPYANIEQVLSFDSLNRKAFEYKLAFHLLKKDYKTIVTELPKLTMYGFTKIPVNLEEAAVIYTRLSSGILPAGINLEISESTSSRFEQYLQIVRNYGNNPKIAEPFLRKSFSNTFWYYVFYR